MKQSGFIASTMLLTCSRSPLSSIFRQPAATPFWDLSCVSLLLSNLFAPFDLCHLLQKYPPERFCFLQTKQIPSQRLAFRAIHCGENHIKLVSNTCIVFRYACVANNMPENDDDDVDDGPCSNFHNRLHAPYLYCISRWLLSLLAEVSINNNRSVKIG